MKKAEKKQKTLFPTRKCVFPTRKNTKMSISGDFRRGYPQSKVKKRKVKKSKVKKSKVNKPPYPLSWAKIFYRHPEKPYWPGVSATIKLLLSVVK